MAVVDAVLTEEIITQEILIRLPVKSLVRCRCVCKSWNALLYNPNFLSHLNHHHHHRSCISVSERDDDGDDYLLFMNTSLNTETTNTVFVSILSGKKLSETCIIDNYAPYPLYLNSNYIELVGCINGLVCIAFYFEDIYQFVLWNPTFRLFKKILVPKQLSTRLCLYGFGWDSVTNDYKLIAKLFNNGEVLSAGVYSCKTDCWSDINHLSIHTDISSGWSKHPSVIVNGSPYWYNYIFSEILKFDITSDEFTCFKAPFRNTRGIYTNLLNLNDCLASIKYTRHPGAAEVYRYDEQHNVWTHMYTFDKYCMKYDSIKIHCFKYGGEIVFHGKEHLYLYDPKSREIKSRYRSCPICGACLAESRKRKRRGGSHDCRGSLLNGFSYTPSLVALPGMKALHM